MRPSITLLMVPILLAVVACARGEGSIVAESRSLGPVSRIEAAAGVQVKVTIGPAEPLVVHAQENIQDKLTTDVRSGTLRIEAKEDFVVAEPVVIDVTVPSLDGISLSGGASIEVQGLTADSLDLWLAGGARATITGSVERMTLQATGGAVASLAGLSAVDVTVELNGGATADVQATGSVEGTASGGAQLRVAGGALVDVATSGGAVVREG
jgi:hypothetical protein